MTKVRDRRAGSVQMRILIVEDDERAATAIAESLRQQGHEVVAAADGNSGLKRASTERFDLLVVDRMLPELDGLSLVRRLRRAGRSAPVLMLTALGSVEDRVDGLEGGADDYLIKPFAPMELIARVNALARRLAPAGSEATTLTTGDLSIDRLKRTVARGDLVIDLQPREFQLLEFLMLHAGEIVTRTMLLEAIWDFHFDPRTNIVETHMSRLRAKIDRPGARNPIETIRGAGYVIRPV